MRNQKGITLLSLTIIIVVMMILTFTIAVNIGDYKNEKVKTDFTVDMQRLTEEIRQYYARKKVLPIINKYTNIFMFEGIKNINDNDNYYVIDLEQLDVKVNYGKDYNAIKEMEANKEIADLLDVYIINEQSHTIYYPKGVEYDGVIHYRLDEKYSLIDNMYLGEYEKIYEYTGDAQIWEVPFTGDYEIKAYGAQGKSYKTQAIGGKGSYVKGTIRLQKGDILNIYVGGQNNYNGGGAKSGDRLAGGGASDIRYGGTEIGNRILVAAGGGGSYAKVHNHSKANGCYTSVGSSDLGCTVIATHPTTDSDWTDSSGEFHDYNYYDIKHYDGTITYRYHGTNPYHTHDKLNCTTKSSYKNGNKETEGQVTTTLYQGNEGGGGGYYGGKAGYGGTSYVDINYFKDYKEEDIVTGIQEGNGYVKITAIK